MIEKWRISIKVRKGVCSDEVGKRKVKNKVEARALACRVRYTKCWYLTCAGVGSAYDTIRYDTKEGTGWKHDIPSEGFLTRSTNRSHAHGIEIYKRRWSTYVALGEAESFQDFDSARSIAWSLAGKVNAITIRATVSYGPS